MAYSKFESLSVNTIIQLKIPNSKPDSNYNINIVFINSTLVFDIKSYIIQLDIIRKNVQLHTYTNINTHTQIYIYIYIHVDM